MSDSDLSHILQEWPYESGRVNVRLITAHDGRPLIQMRLDLGVLQMEVNGRPDGQRPEGCASWLERYAMILSDSDSTEDFSLSAHDCRRLREEALQFYHRYIALFSLDQFDGVIRDTTHNLAIMDLCHRFGETEFERRVMDSLRPNTIMMRVRAQAAQMVAIRDKRSAIGIIDEGLSELRQILSRVSPDQAFEDAPEVQLLRAMRASLIPALPASQRSELIERLNAALAAENYELAAILRDELRMMRD